MLIQQPLENLDLLFAPLVGQSEQNDPMMRAISIRVFTTSPNSVPPHAMLRRDAPLTKILVVCNQDTFLGEGDA